MHRIDHPQYHPTPMARRDRCQPEGTPVRQVGVTPSRRAAISDDKQVWRGGAKVFKK